MNFGGNIAISILVYCSPAKMYRWAIAFFTTVYNLFATRSGVHFFLSFILVI